MINWCQKKYYTGERGSKADYRNTHYKKIITVEWKYLTLEIVFIALLVGTIGFVTTLYMSVNERINKLEL